jgi:hypothetical protein
MMQLAEAIANTAIILVTLSAFNSGLLVVLVLFSGKKEKQ